MESRAPEGSGRPRGSGSPLDCISRQAAGRGRWPDTRSGAEIPRGAPWEM